MIGLRHSSAARIYEILIARLGAIMQTTKFSFPSTDSHTIHGIQWLPTAREGYTPKAAIHIVHGMAEYAARYQRLAEHFVEQGYAVFAHDVRGHGQYSQAKGHYADENGWQANMADIFKVNQYIQLTLPKAPKVILGHSMGTHLVKSYLQQHGNTVDASILSASFGNQGLLGKAALLIAKFERWRCGPKNSSSIIHALTFGAWEKKYTDHGTAFDWLNRDREEVFKYSKDTLCGFQCSTQLWLDFFTALNYMHKPNSIELMPKNMPMLLMTGTDDISNDMGRGCKTLVQQLEQTGLSSLTYKEWPMARHELFNEINRQEISTYTSDWLNSTLPTLSDAA